MTFRMEISQSRSRKVHPTYVAAICGGILGIVLMTRHTLVAEGGTYYPLEIVFVGSLLAGFLARRNGGTSQYAGIAAAILAVLPTFLSVSHPVSYYLETDGIYGIGSATGIVVLFVIFVILVAVMIGSLAGAIGGWVGSKFTVQPAT